VVVEIQPHLSDRVDGDGVARADQLHGPVIHVRCQKVAGTTPQLAWPGCALLQLSTQISKGVIS
jgi:hypothetical protein